MCEIPWQNIALYLFALAVREHPEWDRMAVSFLASDIERHALDRGAACVGQSDVRATLETRAAEQAVTPC